MGGRDGGDAVGAVVAVTKVRPTARTRRPARPLRGWVGVEPPSATGETARRRGGDGEGEADGEDVPPLAAIPGACRCRAPDHYRRDGATLLGNVVISKNFLRTCKIMVMA